MDSLSFPPEIWLYVTRLIDDRNDLRAMRLTSKDLEQAAAPQLFNTIYLRPNMSSFDHAKLLVNDKLLRNYVRALHLCNEALYSKESWGWDYLESMQSFKATVDLLYAPHTLTFIQMAENLEYYLEKCRATVSSQSKFISLMQDPKNSELYDLVRLIPHLERLSLNKLSDRVSPWSCPSYLARFCGLRPDAFGCFQPSHVLEWCTALSPVSFSCETFRWHDQLIIDPILKPKLQFQRLKDLHIRFYFDTRNRGQEAFTPQDRARVGAWDKFLSEAPMLENVSLAIEETHRPSILRQYIFKCLLAHRWPTLRVLALSCCAVAEKEFVAFVSRHRKSLRHLGLHKLQFYGFDDTESCPIRTLWAVGALVSLESIEITGFLRTSLDQFELQKTQQPGSMLDRMCRYLRGLGDFPYPTGLHYPLRLHRKFVSTDRFKRKVLHKRKLIRRNVWRDDLVLDDNFPQTELAAIMESPELPSAEAKTLKRWASGLPKLSDEELVKWKDSIYEDVVDDSWKHTVRLDGLWYT